jgi:uncharacterized coiled-coil DUF342 family protein
MLDNILEKLNSLSEDAQNAAIAKAKELSFNLDKGVVSISESFINLNADSATLRDAIEKKKLNQLPLTVQKNIFEQLENVSKFLTGLTSGKDEVVNLVNAIEGLHTAVWQFGLQNLSEEFLGYQTKLNQVKQLEVQLHQLKAQLEQGLEQKNKLDELLADAVKLADTEAIALQSIEKSQKVSNEGRDSIDALKTKSDALFATIEQNEKKSTDQLSKINTTSSELTALEARIKEFYTKVDEYRTAIDTTKQEANKTVNENNTKTKELTTELDKLEDQIRDSIQRATGHSLFHSFQTRQSTLATGKMVWIYGIGVLVLISIGFSIWLGMTAQKGIDTAFYVKLSITIPLAFAIGFCAVQYSRERRLEEEYAFKGSISISLVPYKELVEKLVDKTKDDERVRFASFIIESVNKVFTSPTDKIWQTTEKDSGNTDKSVKRIVSLLKPLIKEVRH